MFVFNEFGIPGVVIGPAGANAHGTDEYATIESLVSLTEIIARTITEFCEIE
jgi:acetylornithine deacetylase